MQIQWHKMTLFMKNQYHQSSWRLKIIINTKLFCVCVSRGIKEWKNRIGVDIIVWWCLIVAAAPGTLTRRIWVCNIFRTKLPPLVARPVRDVGAPLLLGLRGGELGQLGRGLLQHLLGLGLVPDWRVPHGWKLRHAVPHIRQLRRRVAGVRVAPSENISLKPKIF